MYNLDLCISSRNVRRAEVVIFTYGWLVCLVLTMQIDKWQVVWLVVIHNTNTYFYSACTLVFNLQSFTKNIFEKSSFGLLICTLISENQGLEKLKCVSSLEKCQVLHSWIF